MKFVIILFQVWTLLWTVLLSSETSGLTLVLSTWTGWMVHKKNCLMPLVIWMRVARWMTMILIYKVYWHKTVLVKIEWQKISLVFPLRYKNVMFEPAFIHRHVYISTGHQLKMCSLLHFITYIVTNADFL